MKIRHIKTRLFARLARYGRPFKMTNAGPRTYPDIQVVPKTDEEYHIGRKEKSVEEILKTDIEVIPDSYKMTHDKPLKLVTVARKKDNHVVAHVSAEKAEEMISKAKTQKKAALYVMPEAA